MCLAVSENRRRLLMSVRVFRIQNGFSLLELIATITVLAILVMASVPLLQNSIRRQKEERLREALREMRLAIDEFHRDTIGSCLSGTIGINAGPVPVPSTSDPRSRVVIDDCEIFKATNLDRFPPSLDILVEGVRVKPRGLKLKPKEVFGEGESTVFDETKDLKKNYLREIPFDPFTGKQEWRLRSSYQEKGSETWDDINVFDVRSLSDEEALNGEKYRDW